MNEFSGGNVWSALTSRGLFSTCSPVTVSPVWNLRSSPSHWVLPSSLCSLLLVRPFPLDVDGSWPPGQLVGGQLCWGVEGSLWRAQQPVPSEKHRDGFQSTCESLISTSSRQGGIDDRKIEVVVDGLPLFHGTQLAVDATLVSLVRRQCTSPVC